MNRLSTFAYRFRWPVVIVWILLIAVSGYASQGLNDLLSNRFDLPDTESTAVLNLLKQDFGQRGDSSYQLIVESADGEPASTSLQRQTLAAAERAAAALGHATIGPLRTAGPLVYTTIGTTREPAASQLRTEPMRAAIGEVPGARTYLSGQTAINRDLQPLVNDDLLRGEAIAVPIAAFVLLFIFGTLISTLVPLGFALATVPTTLGIVWIAAHQIDMAIYVTNLVTLIGIGIAVDYSLLIVYRFREEMLHLQRAKLTAAERAAGADPRLVALDRTSNLLAATSSTMLRFKTDQTLPEAIAPQARVTGRIVQLKARDATDVERLLAALRLADVRIEDLEIGRADLEDVFLEIMQAASPQAAQLQPTAGLLKEATA